MTTRRACVPVSPRRARVPARGLLPFLVLLALAACGERAPEGGRSSARYDSQGHAMGEVRVAEGAPNLIVVVLDTLRADAAADPAVMPTLERLRQQGLTFDRAIAPAPWTLPSLTSVLTGLLPSKHGADDARRPASLAPAITTFAEVLANAAGYDTAAFVPEGWLLKKSNLLAGFEHVHMGFHLTATEEQVGPWAAARDPKRPFFLLLHTFEIHDPYGASNHPWPPPTEALPSAVDPATVTETWQAVRAFYLDRPLRDALMVHRGREEYIQTVVQFVNQELAKNPHPELVRELRAAYDEGAHWADGQFATTLEFLRGKGLLDNTLLVVLADHGEAFGEHGTLGHGRVLYDELVHVPLVMVGPGPFSGGQRYDGVVSLLDVMPTYLDLIGLPPLDGADGVSLLPRLRGPAADPPVLSEERIHRGNTGRKVEGVRLAVRSALWKYIVTYDQVSGVVREELFDLSADPREQNDLVRPDGTWPEGLAPEPDFCAAVEAARDRVWSTVADRARIYATPYGADVERTTSVRPPPACQ